MKNRVALAASVFVAVSVAILPPKANAWEDLGVGAEIYRNEWNKQLCNNSFTPFPAVVAVRDPFSPTFASQQLQARDAEANAYWMWLREGGLSPVWQWSPTCAPRNAGYPGGGWFDGSEEANNNWYESTAVINSGISLSCMGGNLLACTGLDWAWWGYSEILSADIVVSNTYAWDTVNQDTLRECLLPTAISNFETTYLHELGHAYGIAHNNAVLTTMNRDTTALRNCNMTQAYNDQPWPDDMSAMQHKYGTIPGRHNLAASPWYGPVAAPTVINADQGFKTGIGDSINTFISASSPTSTQVVAYTLEKYWDGAAPNSVVVRFVLVPIGSLPIFNWTTHTWSYPAGSSTRWILDPITTPMSEGNSRRDTSMTFQLSDVGPGTYRLFLEVDPSHLITETDEGDNVIPMNFVLRRL